MYSAKPMAAGLMPPPRSLGYFRTMTTAIRPPLAKRMRRGHWTAVDGVLGALIGGAGVFLAVRQMVPLISMPRALAIALALALGVAVGLRRPHPWAAVWIVTVASPILAVASTKFPYTVPLVWALVFYTLAEQGPRSSALRGLAAVITGFFAGLVFFMDQTASAMTRNILSSAIQESVALVIPLIGVWTIGLSIGTRRLYNAGLREQAEQRAREQVSEERVRIARELHDVVAHSLSLITMQAAVANRVRATHPEETAKMLSSIEGTGRTALHEMRRLLGILRSGDGTPRDPDLAPAPTLGDLDKLVADTAGAGLRIELRIVGAKRTLPTGVELAMFRIVQEALTNTIKHADARRGRVLLDYSPDTVRVQVTDDGRGADPDLVPGHGLTGMRERVAAYGGEFEAGSLPGRGFQVTARVPVGAVAP